MTGTLIVEDKDGWGNVHRRLTTTGQRFRNYCGVCGKPTSGWYTDPFRMNALGKMRHTCPECQGKPYDPRAALVRV